MCGPNLVMYWCAFAVLPFGLMAALPSRSAAQTPPSSPYWKITTTTTGIINYTVTGLNGIPVSGSHYLQSHYKRGGAGCTDVSITLHADITTRFQWVNPDGTPGTNPAPRLFIREDSDIWGERLEGGTISGTANDGFIGDQSSVDQTTGFVECKGTHVNVLNSSSGDVSITRNLSVSAEVSDPDDATAQLMDDWAYTVVLQPVADDYQFQDYPNPPPAGTTPHAQTAADFQQNLSDGTFYETRSPAPGRVYTNQTANHALTQLKETALFFVFGHGGSAYQSCQTFWNGSAWSAMVQLPGARTQLVNQGLQAANVVVLDDKDANGNLIIPADAFKKVLLAVFMGCWTGYSNASWGCPVDGVVSHGAKNALGWTTTIYSHTFNPDGTVKQKGAEEWADTFWDKLHTGLTFSASCSAADQVVGLYGGLRNRKFVGADPLTLKITPARYGDQ